MPVGLRWGVVSRVVETHNDLVRLEVDGTPCIAYPRLTGAVQEGDMVLVNDQATALGLGSGGFDLLAVNLTRGLRLPAAPDAHVVAWPYAPGQVATRFAEEDATVLPATLDGRTVICSGLHSQLSPICAALEGCRVAYVQVAGGALPVSLSDTIRVLRARKLLDVTVAVAPCVDADLQCVTLASALLVAAGRGADVIVVGIGPGIVGTASLYGHGGLMVTDAINAATALGGAPIVSPRVSFADPRERHHGLSHHTRSALTLALGEYVVPWPAGLEQPSGLETTLVEVGDWLSRCGGLPLSHMGRGPDDDPWFFATAFAAGRLARTRFTDASAEAELGVGNASAHQ